MHGSTTGYSITLARGQISWRSTLHYTVTFSVMEIEYMAVTKTFKKEISHLELLDDLLD